MAINENENEILLDSYKLGGVIQGRLDNSENVPFYKIKGIDGSNKDIYKKLIFIPIQEEGIGAGKFKFKFKNDIGKNILFSELIETAKSKIVKLFNDELNKLTKKDHIITKADGLGSDIETKNSKILKYEGEGDGDTYLLYPILLSTECDKLNESKNFKIFYDLELIIKEKGKKKYIEYDEKSKSKYINIKVKKKDKKDKTMELINQIATEDYGVYLPIIEVYKKEGTKKEGTKKEGTKKIKLIRGNKGLLYDHINYDPPKVVGKVNNETGINSEENDTDAAVNDTIANNVKISFIKEYAELFDN